jgi:hypothetical protein
MMPIEDDIRRIRNVCYDNGFEVEDWAAQEAWMRMSRDRYRRDWEELPDGDDDDALWDAIEGYIYEED